MIQVKFSLFAGMVLIELFVMNFKCKKKNLWVASQMSVLLGFCVNVELLRTELFRNILRAPHLNCDVFVKYN